MKRTQSLFALLLVATTAVACDSWDQGSRYDYPVFSDDGGGIAAVYMEFEGKDTITHLKTRNYQTQVLRKDNTGSTTPMAITDLMPGRVADLFYMRSAGYLILGRHGDEFETSDGHMERYIAYDRVSLNGEVTSLGEGTFRSMLSCDGGTSKEAVSSPLRVIPSPDGQLLARFEATTTCESRVQTVTLLDAEDLSVVDGPFEIPEAEGPASSFANGPGWTTLDMGWTESGAFGVSYWGSGETFASTKATLYKAGHAVQKGVTMSPGCFYPPTSSSGMRADGYVSNIDEASGAIAISNGANAHSPTANGTFGCN